MPDQQDNPAVQAVTDNFTESVESAKDRLDNIHSMIDRQRMRAEIPDLESALEQAIKRLEMHKDGLAANENAYRKPLNGATMSAIAARQN